MLSPRHDYKLPIFYRKENKMKVIELVELFKGYEFIIETDNRRIYIRNDYCARDVLEFRNLSNLKVTYFDIYTRDYTEYVALLINCETPKGEQNETQEKI